jgi:hypothetical protein
MKRLMILSLMLTALSLSSESLVGPAGELMLPLEEQTPENVTARCAATNSNEDILINGQVKNPFEECLKSEGLPITTTPATKNGAVTPEPTSTDESALTAEQAAEVIGEPVVVDQTEIVQPIDDHQLAEAMQDPAFQAELQKEIEMLEQDPAVQREIEEAMKDPEFLKFLESFASQAEQGE